jgi:hypothetical protein
VKSKQYVLGVLAMCAAACSPASDPVAPEVAGNETAAPEAPAPEPVAPEPVAPADVVPELEVQGPNTQGASMQGGNDQGGGQPQANALDPRLVGTWVNEKQINSGGGAGGFASFSTVMTMVMSADGRIQQYSQSVGGGGDWSSNSGRTMDFDGTWRAGNGTLLVHGMGLPDYTPAATYTFSGEYLVTQNDQGRLIWQRR